MGVGLCGFSGWFLGSFNLVVEILALICSAVGCVVGSCHRLRALVIGFANVGFCGGVGIVDGFLVLAVFVCVGELFGCLILRILGLGCCWAW